MDFEEIYREDLANCGWARYLKIKKTEVALFDRTIIDTGRRAKEKWKKIAGGETSDGGTSDCSYCAQFHKSDELGCNGCPIKLFTKGPRCIATPYYTYVNNPTTSNAMVMKDFVDEIFIRSLLLIDWRKYYEMSKL